MSLSLGLPDVASPLDSTCLSLAGITQVLLCLLNALDQQSRDVDFSLMDEVNFGHLAKVVW